MKPCLLALGIQTALPITLQGRHDAASGGVVKSKKLRDRQTFVQLVGHLVDDDLAGTASIVSYYQTLPDMERLFAAPNSQDTAQQWIAQKFFTYPRIDGMFIAAADGKLLGTLPAAPNLLGQPFHPDIWI